MKTLKLMVLGCLVWIGFGTSVCALDLAKVGMFAAGFASGTVFHEVGHAATAIALGGKVSGFYFQGVEVDFSEIPVEKRNEARRIIGLSGYAAQSLATEVIINQKDWHENDYALGWMSLGIFVNLSNPIRYYVFGQKDNDLGLYEKEGGDPAIPAALMVAHASWTLYRMFNDTDIPLYITANKLGLKFDF